MWKYYYSEKQYQSYVSENTDSNKGKCRTFAKGKEFTYATNRDALPPQFDDYVFVLESEEELKEESGYPY